MNNNWWEDPARQASRRTARVIAVALVLTMLVQMPTLLLAPQSALAFTSTFDFSTSGDYSFDATKVKFASGTARAERTPDWWDTNYQYRKRITVTASSIAVTTDDTITVKTDVDALVGASKVQADTDDLRVVYWNGSTNSNIDREYVSTGLDDTINSGTDQNDIRFKAQAAISASASDNGYYLYYGHSGATAGPSNPANIYRYFENFSTDVIGSGAWTTSGTGWSVTGGRLTKTSTEALDRYATNTGGTSLSTASGWYFESTIRRTSASNTVSIGFLTGVTSPSGYWITTFPGGDMEIWRAVGKLSDGTGTLTVTQNTDYRETGRFIPSGGSCGSNWSTVRGWLDGVQYVNASENNASNCPGTAFGGVHAWNSQAEWDDYKVWKYLNESIGLGSEETTYPNDNPTVTPVTPVNFTVLSSFSATVSGTGAVQYILSNNGGSSWLYHNGASWVASDTTFAQSTTATNVNANIGTFPVGNGSLLFRAFLNSDGTQTVHLDTVTINGNAKPATPTPATPTDGSTTASLTPSFTLSTTDGDSDAVKYKLQIDTSNGFASGNLQTFDQTSSQTGWSGQDAAGNTAYASGSTATFTLSTALTPAIGYYWRVAAIDTAGSNTFSDYSATKSFITPAAVGLSAATVTGVNADAVRVTWTTTGASTSTVRYGLTNSYGTTVTSATNTTSHSVLLTGLTPATQYHYQVESVSSGQTETSSDATFTSPAVTPTILKPLDNAHYTTVQSINVIGLALSGQTVKVYVDGTLNGTVTARTTTTGVGDFVHTLSGSLSTGIHEITVKGVTNNIESVVSADRSVIVTLPAIPPTVLSPLITDGVNPAIYVRGLAPAGSDVRIYLDGKLVKTVTATNSASGVGSFSGAVPITGLRIGRHTISVIGIGDGDRPSKEKTAATFSVLKNGQVQTRFTSNARTVVAGGQSLWQLAQQFYGDGRKYTKIVDANKAKFPTLVTNPSFIRPGWQLVIPK